MFSLLTGRRLISLAETFSKQSISQFSAMLLNNEWNMKIATCLIVRTNDQKIQML